MAVKTNGSGYLGLASKLVSSFPFSIAYWGSADAGGVSRIPVTQSHASQDRYTGFFFDSNNTTKYGSYRNPGAGGLVSQAGGENITAALKLWVLVVHGPSGANNLEIFCHSATSTKTTSAFTDDIANHDVVTIGGTRSNGAFNFGLDGNIAEVGFFNVALSAANVTALLAGGKPEDIAGCVACFPLRSATDLTSTNGTYTLVASGTVANGTVGHPVTRSAPGPTISAHPSNQTVTTPTTAAFSVTAAASGGGSLTYQWQRSTNSGGSWSNVSTGTGGTTSSYTTAATTVSGGNANNADQWRCVVTETGGSNPGAVNSNAATLTVNAAPSGPTINTQPTSQTVTTPATATFTVAATTSGGALSYQWQRSTNSGGSWSSVTTGTGGTTNSYTTAATTVSGGNANSGDQYRCAVSDSNGTTNSNAATLTVNAVAPTLNFQAAGMEFGRRTGLGIGTFALDAGSNYRYTVHADGLVLGAAVYTSGVVATDSNGKLPNYSSGSLSSGTTYRVIAVRQADGEAATFRMVAA